MKPVIIYKEKDSDKIVLSEEELEKLITDIYEQGFEDGKKYRPSYIPQDYTTIKQPDMPNKTGITWETGKRPWWIDDRGTYIACKNM